MQVFVEEVGLWMDSMDPMKHVGSPLQFPVAKTDGSPLVLSAATFPFT
jgi:hypothetical protein